MPNLFKSLSRYGSSQSENYLTEAFVFLLKELKGRAPNSFYEIIGEFTEITSEDIGSDKLIVMSTQSGLVEGRPDIRIDIADKYVVFVEVKNWSPLSDGQLEMYYEQIQKEYADRGKLVLLTRSRQSIQETQLDPTLFHHVCWYEIHSWFGDLNIEDEILRHYVHEFKDFLEGKAMGVQKVSWEYENGITSMLILTNQLETAVAESWPQTKIKRTAGWSWRGLYVDETFFIGCRFDEPTILVFENNMGTNPTNKAVFDFETVHFFSLNAGEQLEAIATFIRSAREEIESN